MQHRETDLQFVQRLLAVAALVLRREEHTDTSSGQRMGHLAGDTVERIAPARHDQRRRRRPLLSPR